MPLNRKVDQFKNLGQVWRSGSRSLRRELHSMWLAGATKIMQESIKNAPVDLGNLEKAHRLVVKQNNDRKLVLHIEVGGTTFVRNGRTVSTDEYATQMHEGFYRLGSKSLQKDISGKNKVGRKFLTRAFDDNIQSILNDIGERVRRALT